MNVVPTFSPNWASPPGDTIRDILFNRNISINEFASALSMSDEMASSLLFGGIPLSTEIAEKLARVLGSSPSFWITRESRYRTDLVRIQTENQQWVETLPIEDMIEYGWIPRVHSRDEKALACLNFFNIRNSSSWAGRYSKLLEATAFRSSPAFSVKKEAVLCWLRQGHIEAEKIESSTWDVKAFRQSLNTIRALTREKDPRVFIPKLQEICARSGVLVTIVRAPSGCPVSGATLHHSESRRLLILSFRYLSDDQFWFTFFHEAGHLILHDTKDVILEYKSMKSELEDEANEFAMNVIMSSDQRDQLMTIPTTAMAIVRFASRIGVSPGVIVGQLQFSGRIDHRYFNQLKYRFRWD